QTGLTGFIGLGLVPQPRHRRILSRKSASDTEDLQLVLHEAERYHSFAEQFIEHLREARVHRRKTAEDSFIAGEMFKAGTRAGEITNGKQKEENRQRAEDDLQRAI